jgi:hypothetical protein
LSQQQAIYRKINLIIAGVLLCIFIYSGFFAYTGFSPAVPSFNDLLTGKPSISTGLSRSFMAIMGFRFFDARQLNPHGPALFTFFLIQLIFRLFLVFSPVGKYYSTNEIVLIDILISIGMFIVFFEPFIRGS